MPPIANQRSGAVIKTSTFIEGLNWQIITLTMLNAAKMLYSRGGTKHSSARYAQASAT
jgi:hypothetical protein